MHVAIIMDGNGRWANERNFPRSYGHKNGMENVITAVEWANDHSCVDTLTLYAFSKENWKRPAEEVSFLMELLIIYLKRELENLHKKNAIISIYGNILELPNRCQEMLNYAVDLTKNNTGLKVNFAINYSSLDEVSMAIKSILRDYNEEKINIEDIDDRFIFNYLYSKNHPLPDLIIRTGGQKRLSNFLLLQSAYSELIFIDKYWPDVRKSDLDYCIDDFLSRTRNYGGVKDE